MDVRRRSVSQGGSCATTGKVGLDDVTFGVKKAGEIAEVNLRAKSHVELNLVARTGNLDVAKSLRCGVASAIGKHWEEECIGPTVLPDFADAHHLFRPNDVQNGGVTKLTNTTDELGLRSRAGASRTITGGKVWCLNFAMSPDPRGWPSLHMHLYARSLVWTVWEDQSGDVFGGVPSGSRGGGMGRRPLALALFPSPRQSPF